MRQTTSQQTDRQTAARKTDSQAASQTASQKKTAAHTDGTAVYTPGVLTFRQEQQQQ